VNESNDPEIHPELRTIAKVLPRGLSTRSFGIVRRVEAAAGAAAPVLARLPRPRRAQVEVVELDGCSMRVHLPHPGFRAEIHPALLWIHGGGYVIGSAAQEDAWCRRVASELGAIVASVEYRRAPEHPFPTPLEDCHRCLVALAARDDVDAQRVAIGGASAGGGLAAALALLARDRGEVTPVLQLLSYPMLDDRTVLRDDIDERGMRMWNNASNELGWRSYLGSSPGSDDVSGLAAPARCENLAELPATWLGVGSLDLFLDEDLVYAERLRAAGVGCQVHLVDGAFHAFDYLAPRTAISREFRRRQIEQLSSALNGAGT
jgi:acetyl esterase/lipase